MPHATINPPELDRVIDRTAETVEQLRARQAKARQLEQLDRHARFGDTLTDHIADGILADIQRASCDEVQRHPDDDSQHPALSTQHFEDADRRDGQP